MTNKNKKSITKKFFTGMNKAMTLVGKATVNVVSNELKKQHERNLIKNAFSTDKAKRIIALSKLKKQYPETYQEVKKELGRE
jgi:murein endopeptidase